MMTNDPDRIRADIEQTRNELSEDVDAVRERVRPGTMARRQGERVRGAMGGLKDRVMGAASDVASTGGGAASSVRDTASTMTGKAGEAPAMVRERTAGNPLAAGVIAFGAGWLASTVIPASRAERRAAQTVKEQASGMAQGASSMARDLADDLREPARESVDAVRSTAQDAVQTVRDERSG
jgi:hypothetical protein